MSVVNFKANVRIKDVVGRDLINNDNVAVIELIKNSKDAGSNHVIVTFSEANKESEHSQIIIQDFGHGMTMEDITEKWLNMAWSDKRGALDSKKQVFAGSKGIGRFSCDRLGRNLDLYTKTKDGKLLWLSIDWTKFEVDERDKEISHVKFKVEEINYGILKKRTGIKKSYSSGTILVIRDLRAVWDRDKLLDLRRELEKFSIDPKKKFFIDLECTDYRGISGRIKNKVFERLTFRTTSIHSSINKDGTEIETVLSHDGKELFTLVEKSHYKHLKNIEVQVYFLNQQAKAFFKRETGSTSVDFGSIFLFLNGFRVLPYGEESDDWLGLDRRKQQGTKRFFGTRELIGRVEINENVSAFKPVSSREGLVINDAYRELTANDKSISSKFDKEKKVYGFIQNVVRKLEKFVVEGLDWDRLIKEDQDQHISEGELLSMGRDAFVNRNKDIVSGLWSIILTRTAEVDIVGLNINDNHLRHLAEDAGHEYEILARNMRDRLKGVSISSLSSGEKKNLSKFINRVVKEVEAKEASNTLLQQQAKKLDEQKTDAERKLVVETKRRLFAEASTSLDYKHVLHMHHQIGLLAGDVFKKLNKILRRHTLNPDNVSKDELVDIIEKSLFNISKIKQASKFATKANFDMATNNVREDVVQFLEEYIDKVCENGADWGLKVKFENKSALELKKTFRPIELTMIVDNLMDNASKARARNLLVEVSEKDSVIRIKFTDDGKGIDTSQFKPDDLLQKGITTTDGSGIGLYHVSQIISDMKGTIKIGNNREKGAFVLLEF